MWSQMVAITGPRSRQPASAGGIVFSRVGGLGARTFFGVGGGVTHGVLRARDLRGGGFMRSWPERLSTAIRLCVSITMCSDERNGIPSIMGKHSPLFTFILVTPDFHWPCPDCTSNLTYSVQESGEFVSDDRLSSLLGSLYHRRPSVSQSSRLITVQGQPMSISAQTMIGNPVIRGLVTDREVYRWGTVKGTSGVGGMYKSVSLSSLCPWVVAATGSAVSGT
jgi:hypothetical protein